MAMITDPEYILQAIRLAALRRADDPITPRVIALDPAFSLNPYINTTGLSDVDRWPEIKRALDSPPLEARDEPRGLRYTQTIMGGRRGGAGMRVSGRAGGRETASVAVSPILEAPTVTTDGFFSPRPRSDSAPAQVLDQVDGLSTSEASDLTPGTLADDIEVSVQPSEFALTAHEHDVPLGSNIDEGSDVEVDEVDDVDEVVERPSNRSSVHEQLVFAPVPVQMAPARSNLSSLLNKHIPHLVSSTEVVNPFASYASVAAFANAISLELYFPHSDTPTRPTMVKVRKDATVEEVTGYGLFRYWEDGQRLEDRLSTVGWGLRIVEDDGEVDEDFPPLDRESHISKFSYGQFAIVEASEAQIHQNAKAPPRARPSLDSEGMGSVGLSSALSNTVLLRVRVTASADVHFTTTISVPSDMYIADLLEVLCKKKRLQGPSLDWVLCLADLTLALPLDRTVASLEGRTDLALVRRQWAVEHGLRIGDRRGGDPSASIFKRISEPAPLAKFGAGVDVSQAYKKYHVLRKIAIGRHERMLAIDGDYIHIMPSEQRTFFDSMKTTSFHISLVVSCKLTGRAGGFKMHVWRDGGQKRYEFEADNGRQAAEIVSSIRQLMKSYQAERRR